MGITPQASASFAQTLMAMAKMSEISRENRSQQAAREELTRSRQEITRAAEEKAREERFGTMVEGTYGQKADPSLEPFLTEARGLNRPGASVTAPLRALPRSIEGIDATTAPTGNLINRPAHIGDVAEALQRGYGPAKEETNQWGQVVTGGVETPALGRLRAERGVTPKEKVLGRLEEPLKYEQQATLTKQGAFNLSRAEEKAPLEQRKLVAETGAAESKAIIDAATAEYATQNAENDARIKQGEMLLKGAAVGAIDLNHEKLEEEVKTSKLNRVKIATNLDNLRKLTSLRDVYLKESDPIKQLAILKNITVLNGHEATLITENRAIQQQYIDITTKDAPSMLVAGSKAFREGRPDEGMQLTDAYNKAQMVAASIVGSPRTKILVTGIAPGYAVGSAPAILGEVSVNTDIAKLWFSGQLEQVAQGLIQIPGLQPGAALANIAILKTGISDPAQISRLIKYIADYPNVDQITKEQAIARATAAQSRSFEPSITLGARDVGGGPTDTSRRPSLRGIPRPPIPLELGLPRR